MSDNSILQNLVDASSKEVNQDFLKSMKTIELLTPNKNLDFKKNVSVNSSISLGKKFFYFENKNNLQNIFALVKDTYQKNKLATQIADISDYDSKAFIEKEVSQELEDIQRVGIRNYHKKVSETIFLNVNFQCNFADFLVLKLVQNLKRCYSASAPADKKKSFDFKNKEHLLSQQDNIIDVLEYVFEKDKNLKLSDNHMLFNSVFLNPYFVSTSTNVLFACLTHQDLTEKNAQRLLNLSSRMVNFSRKKENLTFFLNTGFGDLLYKQEYAKNVMYLLSLMPKGYIQEIMDMKTDRDKFYKGRFHIDLLEHCALNNIALDNDQKMSMVEGVFYQMNNRFFHLKDDEKSSFVSNVSDYFKDFSHPNLSRHLNNIYCSKNKSLAYVFSSIFKGIESNELLVQIIKDVVNNGFENLNETQKFCLESLSMDEHQVIKAAKIIAEQSKILNKDRMLLTLIDFTKVKCSKEFISEIISINPVFYSTMEPFIRKIDLEQRLSAFVVEDVPQKKNKFKL